MRAILEGIFKGFIQWIYGLFLEIVQYIANSLLEVFQMDLDYFRQAAPISDEILNIVIAVGWALLLGNLVFQAVKSMATGLGFEGEDPKLLFTRTFVFAFLLLASPQICEIGLGISSQVISLLQVPSSVTITIPDESNFHIGASWLLIIIVGFVIMWQFVKLCFEVAERYVVTAILVLLAPLAFGMGGSKNTEDIFKAWCRMFGSMCVMMVLNVVFLKLLISVLGYVPRGVAVLPWMLLIVGIARVARKIDSIVARLGLNPAITGDGLGRGLPGMVGYAIVKGIGVSIGKAAGHAAGSHAHGGSPGGSASGPRTSSGPPPAPPPSGGSGASAGAVHAAGQQGTQANSRPPAQGGGTVFQNTEQETGRGPGAASPGEPRAAEPEMSGAGRVQSPEIHTREARRTSVPPEARRTMNRSTYTQAAYMRTAPMDGPSPGGTVGPQRREGAPGSPQQGTISRTFGPAGGRRQGTRFPSGGITRVSSARSGTSTLSHEEHITSTGSHRGIRPPVPIQQEGTPKIPAPPGVAGGSKADRQPPAPRDPVVLNGVQAHPPSAGFRKTRRPGVGSGTAGIRPAAGSGDFHAEAAPPAGTAGTGSGVTQIRTRPGQRDTSSGTAGTVPSARRESLSGGGKAPSSGTAGTAAPIRHDAPPVGRRASPTGTAGTRRSQEHRMPGAEPHTPPSGTAGTGSPSGVNRGTRRIKMDPSSPPVAGGNGKKPKTRKKRSDS